MTHALCHARVAVHDTNNIVVELLGYNYHT